jgi:hypothetical protein
VWEVSEQGGAALREGITRRQFLFNNTMDRMVYWQSLYEQVDLAGTAPHDGKTCWRVKAVPVGNIGPEELLFDQESGLLVGQASMMSAPSGPIPTKIFFEDYREVDGVKLPFRIRIQIMEQERVVQVESIRHNVALDIDPFRVPPAVQALVDEKISQESADK